jgi:predicted GNAT family acetyltransferase
MPADKIVENAALHRFELERDGETAFVLYSKTQNVIKLIHTEVPDALRGKGVGSKLVGGVLRQAEQAKLSVIPSCPFVAQYVKRHPEFASIVDPESRWMIASTE